MRVGALCVAFAFTSPLFAGPIDGVVVPARQHEVTIPIPGIVERVHVEPGQQVEQGALLAAIDSRSFKLKLEEAATNYQLAVARLRSLKISGDEQLEIIAAELAANEAQLNLAEQTYQRAKKLHESSAITESEVRQAEQQLIAAKTSAMRLRAKHDAIRGGVNRGELTIAETQVQLAKVAVEAAKLRVEQCAIRSPIKGRVLKSTFQAGAYAQPAAASITVADVDNLAVEAYIAETRLAQVKVGLKCRVMTSAGEVEGKVRSVAPIVNHGQVRVVVQLDASKAQLLPGMAASVSLSMPDTE